MGKALPLDDSDRESNDIGNIVDLEWLQSQLLNAALHDNDDDEDDDGWVDPTDGTLTEILEVSEAGKFNDLPPLLEALNADINTCGPDGDTALHIASLYGSLECVKLLLEKGALPDTVNPSDGSIALHDACASGFLEIAELLISKAPETVSLADEDGDTPLHNAARGGHKEIVQLLLSSGANPCLLNKARNTPAKEADEDEIIEMLRSAAATYKQSRQ